MTEHTNPYQGLDESCCPAEAGGSAPTGGVALLAITVVLLMMGVTLSVLQKNWEGQVGIGVAARVPSADVAGDIHKAKVAQLVGVSTAMLAIVTWGWAFYRKESSPVLHLSVATLLIIFLLMQLLMV